MEKDKEALDGCRKKQTDGEGWRRLERVKEGWRALEKDGWGLKRTNRG